MDIIEKYEKMDALIRATGIEAEYVSPNFVADLAYENGIKLDSSSVVFISDNYED
jgi:hypothetical protein